MFTYPHVCMWTCSLAYRAFPHLAKPVVERLGHRVLSAHAVLAGGHVHGEGHFRAEIARHGLLALTARRNRDRKSTRLNSSHQCAPSMPSTAGKTKPHYDNDVRR